MDDESTLTAVRSWHACGKTYNTALALSLLTCKPRGLGAHHGADVPLGQGVSSRRLRSKRFRSRLAQNPALDISVFAAVQISRKITDEDRKQSTDAALPALRASDLPRRCAAHLRHSSIC